MDLAYAGRTDVFFLTPLAERTGAERGVTIPSNLRQSAFMGHGPAYGRVPTLLVGVESLHAN